MNPQIQQLALEAQGTRKYVPPVWQFFDHELEYFAHLLVDKCISKAEVCGLGTDAANMIKRDFGVQP